MKIGIAIAISISNEDRNLDRNLDRNPNFGDRSHALHIHVKNILAIHWISLSQTNLFSKRQKKMSSFSFFNNNMNFF